MDMKHQCNDCPHWYVTQKQYPSGLYNETFCRKYGEQLYYLFTDENRTPHLCNKCSKEKFSFMSRLKKVLDKTK